MIVPPGGSVLGMEGEAEDLVVSCSGGSRLGLSDFTVNDADVDLCGGSQRTIDLSGRLDADLSGGSRLYYLGNPALGDIATSGGATVSQKQRWF